MTKAAITMPKLIEKPISANSVFPASIMLAKVPARIAPAAATVGPAWRSACAAASLGSRPSRASSRSREIIRML